jgi:hypothetical protein
MTDVSTKHAPKSASLGLSSKARCLPALPSDDCPFPTAAVDLEYPLLGPRAYAHGSSMLQGMLEAVRLREPNYEAPHGKIREFKVIRQFDTLSRAEVMASSDVTKHPRLRQAAARLDVDVEGRRLTSLLFPRPAAALGRLTDYDPAGYLGELTIGPPGSPCAGEFSGVSDFVDLIRGLNECNRQATVASFPNASWSKRVRWAYIQDLAILPAAVCAQLERVEFSAPQALDLGKHRFEIKQGRLIGAGTAYDFTICFFIELPAEHGA